MTAVPVPEPDFREELIAAGHLVPLGVDGVFGRSALFEAIVDGIESMVTRAAGDDGATRLRFPPVLPRRDFECTDYLRSFPDLIGSIHGFRGGDADHARLLGELEQGGDWSAHLGATDLMLCPAACYPIYPTIRGTIPAGGRLFDVLGWCFRHEPSPDPARMQLFRQREYVRIGRPDDVVAFRDQWVERGTQLLRSLGLTVEPVVASDPFFGRAGRMLAGNQREQKLKFELMAPISDPNRPGAIASANYHQDHLGASFGIRMPDGKVAHSACIGFGMERITLALFLLHGLQLASWPVSVRRALGL